MGAWLWLAEQRRAYGLAALVAGTGWFCVLALVVIPAITGLDAANSIGDDRYARDRRLILAWSAVAFLVFARYPRVMLRYAAALESAPAARTALAQIPPDAAVLTDNCLGAHLAHRREVHLIGFAVTPDAPAVPPAVEYIAFGTKPACSVDAEWLARWRASLPPEFGNVVDGDFVVLRRAS